MNIDGTAPEVIFLGNVLGDQTVQVNKAIKCQPRLEMHADLKKDLQNKADGDVAPTVDLANLILEPQNPPNTNVWNFKRISDQDIGLKPVLMPHAPSVNSQVLQNPFNMGPGMSAPGNNFLTRQQNFGTQISNPIRQSINGGNTQQTVIDQKHANTTIQRAGGIHNDAKNPTGFSSNQQNFNGVNVQPAFPSHSQLPRNPNMVPGANLGLFERQTAPSSIFPQNLVLGNHAPQLQRQPPFPFPVTVEGHINLLNKFNEQHQFIVMMDGTIKRRIREFEAQKLNTGAEIDNLKKQLSDQNMLIKAKDLIIAQTYRKMKRQELDKKSETAKVMRELEEARNIIQSRNQEIGKLKQEITKHVVDAEFKRKEIIDKEKEMDEQVTNLKDELAAAQKTIKMKEETILEKEKQHKNKESVWEKEKNLEKRVLESNLAVQNRDHQAERNRWNEEKRKLTEDLKDAVSRNDILEVDFEILREKEARKQAEGQELSRQLTRFFGKSIIDGTQCENEEKAKAERTRRVVKRSLESENDDDQFIEKKVRL